MSKPEDEIAKLRALLAEKESALAASESKASKLKERVKVLEIQLGLLKKQLFGKKSEKLDPRQLLLAFEEALAEAAADLGLEDEPYPSDLLEKLAEAESDGKAGKGKKKRRRRSTKFPADLPVEREEIHPEPDELHCSCGCDKVRMGEEVSRTLERVPASFFWRERVRVKYSCPSCNVITRPKIPPTPFEKGLAGTTVHAEVLLQKYLDHLPLDRLERIYEREGVELSKSTLCSWVEQSTGLLEPVAEAVHAGVLSRPVAQTDETGILVLDPTHAEGRFKGRMWVYCGERGELSYLFTPTKQKEWPQRHLAGFKGTLIADAYAGFDSLYTDGEILEAGCNAHARRKFREAHDAAPKRLEPNWALLAYQRLFAVEREAKEQGLDAEQRLALRLEKSAPIAKELYAWLEQLKPKLTPSDPLYRAVGYALNQRGAMLRFLEDGRVEIHNNRSESALRQVAVGRKNWLFAGSPEGAKRAAIAYTLIMSCKELGVPVREYLIDVLNRVSTHPANRVSELTPRGWLAARQPAAATT